MSGEPPLLLQSQFEVEKAHSGPVYMDHFYLLSPPDAEDVLGGMRMTSCELDLCQSWVVKASWGRPKLLLAGGVSTFLQEGRMLGTQVCNCPGPAQEATT